MFEDRPDGARTFSHVHGLDLACPSCGYTYALGFGPRRSGRHRDPHIWNPRTCRFRCPACLMVWYIGTIIWPGPAHAGMSVPRDVVPVPLEAARLRDQLRAVVKSERQHADQPGGIQINRVSREPLELVEPGCTCAIRSAGTMETRYPDPHCPRHRVTGRRANNRKTPSQAREAELAGNRKWRAGEDV